MLEVVENYMIDGLTWFFGHFLKHTCFVLNEIGNALFVVVDVKIPQTINIFLSLEIQTG